MSSPDPAKNSSTIIRHRKQRGRPALTPSEKKIAKREANKSHSNPSSSQCSRRSDPSDQLKIKQEPLSVVDEVVKKTYSGEEMDIHYESGSDDLEDLFQPIESSCEDSCKQEKAGNSLDTCSQRKEVFTSSAMFPEGTFVSPSSKTDNSKLVLGEDITLVVEVQRWCFYRDLLSKNFSDADVSREALDIKFAQFILDWYDLNSMKVPRHSVVQKTIIQPLSPDLRIRLMSYPSVVRLTLTHDAARFKRLRRLVTKKMCVEIFARQMKKIGLKMDTKKLYNHNEIFFGFLLDKLQEEFGLRKRLKEAKRKWKPPKCHLKKNEIKHIILGEYMYVYQSSACRGYVAQGFDSKANLGTSTKKAKRYSCPCSEHLKSCPGHASSDCEDEPPGDEVHGDQQDDVIVNCPSSSSIVKSGEPPRLLPVGSSIGQEKPSTGRIESEKHQAEDVDQLKTPDSVLSLADGPRGKSVPITTLIGSDTVLTIIYYCRKCPAQVETIELMKAHWQKNHANQKLESSNAKGIVDSAGKIQCVDGDRAERGGGEETEGDFHQSVPADIKKISWILTRCPLCKRHFYNFKTHTSCLFNYRCEECRRIFLQNHLQDPLQPSLTGLGLTDQLPKEYCRLHSKSPVFTCKTCSKNFKSERNLKGHMWTHIREKPNKCPYCDRRFNNPFNMRTHARTHTGEKPYVCGICQEAFGFTSKLKSHEDKFHALSQKYKCITIQK